MSAARRILSNIGALTVARGVTAVLSFVTMVYLARVLEPAAYGMLMWALAYVAYFHLVPDLGLGVWGTREVARAPSRAPDLVRDILTMRFLVAGLTLGLYLGGIFLLDLPPQFRLVVAIQGGALVAAAMAVDFVYQGIERMGVLAVRNVVIGALTLTGVVLAVRAPADVPLAAAALVGSGLVANGWLLLTYRREFGRLRLFNHDRRRWRPILQQSLPIAASLGLVTINLNLDQLLLGIMQTPVEVGLYGAAYRILLAATIPAQIIVLAFVPGLSNAFGNGELMRKRARIFGRVLFSLGLPIAAAGIVLAPDLIALFGPEYAPATTAFAILMVQGGLYYVHQVHGHSLIAWNQQKLYLRALGAGAVVNVLLNLLLIPRFGIEGAAVATVCGEVAMIVALGVIQRRLGHAFFLGDQLRAFAVAVLSIGGVGVARLVFDLPFLPTVALMAVAFLLVAPMFGLVTRDEVRALRASFKRQAS